MFEIRNSGIYSGGSATLHPPFVVDVDFCSYGYGAVLKPHVTLIDPKVYSIQYKTKKVTQQQTYRKKN